MVLEAEGTAVAVVEGAAVAVLVVEGAAEGEEFLDDVLDLEGALVLVLVALAVVVCVLVWEMVRDLEGAVLKSSVVSVVWRSRSPLMDAWAATASTTNTAATMRI